VVADALPAPKGLLYALRVRVDATTSPPTARATGPQGSGLVQSMSVADGLALIPEDQEGAAVGQEVDVMLLPGGLHSADGHTTLSPS